MYFAPDGTFVRTDMWREGKYLDLWSVPHLLSGVALGLAAFFVGFNPVPTFIIALLLLVGYEMFEAIAKIEETPINRTLDVVVGMASFTLAYYLAPLFPPLQVGIALVMVTAVDCVLSWFGWRASRKAAVLERTLREQLRLKRELITEKLADRRLRRKKAKEMPRGREAASL
ncbi:hypothetical protein COU20_03130 [Candidatus Kaiserbacteria bacterium CG10_big_fil_rev_8_21_14_0_10_59_10]|uniref:Uncharacterized protein n=1 Tax=Candidatus Kaiserbacteria bacterium CG10_big_fil_rev_8_21_14_0_10_59_10 TaxID=1974612 RepID=A0A2H0U7B0_9BACT|nr:MAG: hypothetical protein COU20_03130 [Candidatus Kaiserbacteria bacterium CG10_big_fil_rev_8_21_14_0_10_59_10]